LFVVCLFFEKFNMIDKPLARLTKGHRDSILINRIRNEKKKKKKKKVCAITPASYM